MSWIKNQIKYFFPGVYNWIKICFKRKSRIICSNQLAENKQSLKSVRVAIQWIRDHKLKNGGIVISSKQKITYPEVTGYLIPTLYEWGEKELAKELTQWLITQQNPDGSFSAPNGIPYTFDTGQVIRGFIASLNDCPEAEGPLRKACNWVLSQMKPNGQLTTPSTKDWGNIADDRIHLYILSPLIEAGLALNEQTYIDSAKHILEYYKNYKDLIKFNTLTHFYGYIIEALFDLGEYELAKQAMEQMARSQRRDGSIPAYKNVSWVCTPGLAQLAIVFYKLGMYDNAHRALKYLEKIQNPTGGFYGSYKIGADYFPTEEISWAVKFFLDAYYWKIKATFNQEISIFPDTIDENDGRVQELLSFLKDLNGKKIIDVGCGKGRFLRILKLKYPAAVLYGWDLSENMLKFCPENVVTGCGTILNIKYPDNSFDGVYCIETLEHAVNTEKAIEEMVRILKPGGKILIIDKNISELGAMKIEPWEQWFEPEQIQGFLKKYEVESQYKNIILERNSNLNERLFIAWEGKKYE